MAQEPEVSEELDALKSVAGEISDHTKRIGKLAKSGELSEVMVSEFSETLFPLLDEFVSAQLQHSAFVEDWLASLEEEVLSGGGGGAPSGPVSASDLETLSFLLARLHDFLQGALSPEADASPQVREGLLGIETKLREGNKILERLAVAEEDDEESEDEDDA